MDFKLHSKSLVIYSIALITPILGWFIMFMLAQNTSNSFDPRPWIQTYVDSPGQQIEQASFSEKQLPQIIPPSRFNPHGQSPSPIAHWVHAVTHQGTLHVKVANNLIPLNDFQPPLGVLIFLVEAHGPTTAKTIYDFLKDHNLLQNSLVLAVSDGLLKDIRYYDGELALGAGQAYLVRFRALQTLALENFLLINMSGIWLRPEIFKDSTQKLTDTFVKLHVPVFIGPVKREQIPSLPKNANYLIVD